MIQSVARALSILDFVSSVSLTDRGAGLQSVAEHLGVAPTTAHNIARTLVDCGYLRQDERRLYHLGPRCRDLWRSVALAEGVVEVARGVVHGLAQETGESVVLAVLQDGRRHPLLRAEGHEPVRVAADYKEAARLFELVTGRVLAAFATPEELDRVVEVHGYPGSSWEGIVTPEALVDALGAIRHKGYAEALDSGGQVYALAVPVLDREGRLLAALGLFMPAFRATEDRLCEVRSTVAAFAARITTSA